MPDKDTWYVGGHTTARYKFWDDEAVEKPPTPENPEGYISDPAEVTLIVRKPGALPDQTLTLTDDEVKQMVGPVGTPMAGENIGEFYYHVLADSGPGEYIFEWHGETADGFISISVSSEIAREPRNP